MGTTRSALHKIYTRPRSWLVAHLEPEARLASPSSAPAHSLARPVDFEMLDLLGEIRATRCHLAYLEKELRDRYVKGGN